MINQTVKALFVAVFILFCVAAYAQQPIPEKGVMAIEGRLTTYLQGGYDIGVIYYPKKSRLSFGLLVAGHDINGRTKEWLFTSNNHDVLDIRLTGIVSFLTRYHLRSHREGFFGEVGLGVEEFRVKSGKDALHDTNGFVAPGIGYIWHPWGRKGLYLMPKLTGVVTLFRSGEQYIGDTNFRLKSVFATPAFSIGYKF